MKKRGVLSRTMLLTGLILVTTACAQASPLPTATLPTVHSSAPTVLATPQPTATATPIPPSLGPVPGDCPPGPAPQPVDPAEFGPGIGASVAWVILFLGPHATLHVGNGTTGTQYGTYTQYGWERKVLWVISTRAPSSVTLHGGSLRENTPLWFQIGGEEPTRSPVLNPKDTEEGIISGDNLWTEFPSYLLIPKAGCYYLEAQWKGGSWRITFAAGL